MVRGLLVVVDLMRRKDGRVASELIRDIHLPRSYLLILCSPLRTELYETDINRRYFHGLQTMELYSPLSEYLMLDHPISKTEL
jgi:hypothetical protein